MRKLCFLLLLHIVAMTTVSAQWNTNATPVCVYSTAEAVTDDYATTAKFERTSDKKTWIAWKTVKMKPVNGVDRIAVRTYLQLLDNSGRLVFDEPIMVNDHITDSWWSEYGLQVAADGSAIVTVADGRTEEATLPADYSHATTFVPAIYKIDQQGNFLWGTDGIDFRKYDNAAFTNCYVVGKDTYFIFYNDSWEKPEQPEDKSLVGTFIQLINDDGTLAWDEPKKWSDKHIQPQILPLTDEEFLLFDKSEKGSLVHRMNKDMEELWREPVVYDPYKYDGYELNAYRIESDGRGGAAVAFVRNTGAFTHQVRVQHIHTDGTLEFGLTGVDVCNTVDNDYDYCSITANPVTEEMLVLFKAQLSETTDMMLQLFSFDGAYQLGEEGFSIANKQSDSAYNFSTVGCGALENGDWIVIYRDVLQYGDNTSFVIRRYDSNGNRVWTRTIGRNLNPTRVKVYVERDATYIYYREQAKAKNPGITVFRIDHDGGYDISDVAAILRVDTEQRHRTAATKCYQLDGRETSLSSKGLMIERTVDGRMRKVVR